MVSDNNRKKVKEKIYNLVASLGIGFLSKIFPEYFAKEPLRPTDRYIEYPFVLNNIELRPNILDVGCSGSMLPLLLKSLGYEVHGIDIRDYLPKNKFMFTKGSICSTNYDDNEFDTIIAISTIEHIGLERYGAKYSNDYDAK
jgi:2-polyprenyl-3-methyl-5-hydroxy-6-metoxy-1,4-benzoquinol methylase